MKIIRLCVLLGVLFASSYAGAEGTAQVGQYQDLGVDPNNGRPETTLFVDILEIGEVINIAAGNNKADLVNRAITMTLRDPDGVVVVDRANLTVGNGFLSTFDQIIACPLPENTARRYTTTKVGTYTLTFNVQNRDFLDPFDVTVTASTEDTIYPCAVDEDGDGLID